MVRMAARWMATAAALMGLAVGAALAQSARPPKPPPAAGLRVAAVRKAPSFYASFLAPRLDARLHDESAAALEFANRAANPWTRDASSVERVQKGAIRATTGAFKRYAIDRLDLDGWSVPLVGGGGRGLAALRNDAGGTRLRFGFAHMAPRAEVLVPSGEGRFAVSVDTRGRLGASFETKSSSLRIGAAVDPQSHDATLGLIRRF